MRIAFCVVISTAISQAAFCQTVAAPPLLTKPESVSARLSRGFMVPAQVVLRPTTKAEAEAHAVWTLRAALNVSALQCQFSPFLRTVKNYNEAIRHHATELTKSQAVLVGHFKRYDGAQGLNSFDQYTTRTYNSFSTLDAQYNFCDAAATVGRDILRIPRGRLGEATAALNAVLRTSLLQKPDRVFFDPDLIVWTWLPAIPEPAPDKTRGRRR